MAFEMAFARQRPNAADMISMARGNELTTRPAHKKLLNPGSSASLADPSPEQASAELTATISRNRLPNAALDAVAAVPQPSWPASPRAVRSAAANHSRLSSARLPSTDAI